MSRGNFDIVRAGYKAWSRGHVDSVLASLDPEVELRDPPEAPTLRRGTRGRSARRRRRDMGPPLAGRCRAGPSRRTSSRRTGDEGDPARAQLSLARGAPRRPPRSPACGRRSDRALGCRAARDGNSSLAVSCDRVAAFGYSSLSAGALSPASRAARNDLRRARQSRQVFRCGRRASSWAADASPLTSAASSGASLAHSIPLSIPAKR